MNKTMTNDKQTTTEGAAILYKDCDHGSVCSNDFCSNNIYPMSAFRFWQQMVDWFISEMYLFS